MKKKNNSLKIIASTSMTIFSLLTCFVATFAWFTANRNANADGSGFVTSIEPSKIAKVEIFKETSATHYKYESTASAIYENGSWNTAELLDLGTYSSLDRVHTSLIVISLTEEENYSYTLKTSTSYSSSLVSVSNNVPTTKLQASDNPLSSIIRFSDVSYSESLDYSSSQPSDTNKKSFVNESGTSFPENSYSTSLDVSSSTSSNKIAIIVEYFPEALQYIYSINLGNDVMNNETLSFKCDWSIEVK